MIVYGQTELTRDLYEARDRLSGKVVHNAEDVALHDLKSDKPYVTYRPGDETLRVDCDYVVGADSKVHLRAVRIGRNYGEAIEVLDGVGNWVQMDSETQQHSSFNEITSITAGGGTTPILSDDNGNETE